MNVTTNANFKRLLAELGQMGAQAQQSPMEDANYKQFIARFPVNSLQDLSLDAYCVGKGDTGSFCRWLERGLEPVLGRYMPGSSRGHLMYFEKDGTVYKHRHLKDLGDEDALRYVLKVHAAVAGTHPDEDLRWVDDDAQIYQRAGVEPRTTLGDGRKLRLLAAYLPERALPISSSDHAAHFLRLLGCPADGVPPPGQPVARMLKLWAYFEKAREAVPGLTPVGFVRGLYTPVLGLAPLRDADQVLSHFGAVPHLAERLEAAGQTDAFCQLVLALREAQLDWWVTGNQGIHAGRTDDPKVWQTVVAMALECTPQGVRGQLNGPGDGTGEWHQLDAELAAQWANAAAADPRVPHLTGRDPCWPDDYDGSDTQLTVQLTGGAVRNGYLKLPKLQALFPSRYFAADEHGQADSFTLLLPGGGKVQTWLLANRQALRFRMHSVFAEHGVKEGDRVILRKEGDGLYRLLFGSVSPEAGAAQQSPSVPPLVQPDQDIAMRRVPLNQILFGPPGTGKTHATIDHALSILDPAILQKYKGQTGTEARAALKRRYDEFAHAGRIRFVTFHQSFSYEDFVEGLRAESDAVSGQIKYLVKDGVFKTLCEAAAAKETRGAKVSIDVRGRRIWKMSLGNTLGDDAGIYEECLAGGYALLGYGGAIDFQGCHSRTDVLARFQRAGYQVEDSQKDYAITAVTTFVTRMKVGDLLVITDGNFKFRAIGEVTGDYQFRQHSQYEDDYSQSRPVRWLRQYEPSLPHTELMNNQFSQMTLYELRPGSIDPDKLQALLQTDHDSSYGRPFAAGQTFGSGYEVVRVTEEVLELKKPNGNRLPIVLNMLNVLADAVRSERITLADIRDKVALEKIPEAGLEPYLVNGYPNLIPQLVERMVGASKRTGTAGAALGPNHARVLIIDEINRGNVSRVFGELITLIEPSKRAGAEEALSVTLPYSQKSFSVPDNVYLVCTMNTADRSLAGLDVALRRRFVFKEMRPQPELLDDVLVHGVPIGQLVRTMNQRIEALLDREHALGHAYFMPLKGLALAEREAKLAEVFANQVLPLLQEYFFDDWQRIQWVLNDHRKPNPQHRFVQAHGLDAVTLFGAEVNVSPESKAWRVNAEAFALAGSYQGVLASPDGMAVA